MEVMEETIDSTAPPAFGWSTALAQTGARVPAKISQDSAVLAARLSTM